MTTTIHILNQSGNQIPCYDHQGVITSVSFSPTQDSIFLSSSRDGTAKLWRINGEITMDMDLGTPVTKAIFIGDGNHILAGTEEGETFFHANL